MQGCRHAGMHACMQGSTSSAPRGVWARKKGANTRDSTAMSLIRMFSEGPDVSLSGSPAQDGHGSAPTAERPRIAHENMLPACCLQTWSRA